MTPSRREVIAGASMLAAAPIAVHGRAKAPRAIAMWDFSWLERRWPGAGYADWDRALDGLVARGYDAVRIDAFPHLVLGGGERRWTLHRWGDLAWGAPGRVTVQPLPALIDFVGRCARRGVKVALSSWYREDDSEQRLTLGDPARMVAAWIAVLRALDAAGLLDDLLYVDLCNEWPGPDWAAFLTPPLDWGAWTDKRAMRYIASALAGVRAAYPQLPICFSSDRDQVEAFGQRDLPRIDLIEQHVWMGKESGKAFELAIAAATPEGEWMDRVAAAAPALYARGRRRWLALLTGKIDRLARVSRAAGLPLVTTEGWAIVSLRDWPMLDWGWVKDCCAAGVAAAAASGRYLAICTSNFCGPQIAGMWGDVAWHRRQTAVIRAGTIDRDLRASRLYARL